MIINLCRDGWEVIYHRAHALLAAQIGGHWRRSNSPERLYETLAAISHHDDLEREWKGDHLTPVGAPLDFRLGKDDSDGEETIKSLRAHITDSRYRGRWVTLLTSKHLYFLNKVNWDKSQAWNDFLNEQLQLQEEIQQALEVSPEESERAYQFMRWCDRLSLILAERQIPEAGRALEITSGIDGQRYDLRELPDGKLTVEPWCFEDNEFTVNVETCRLSELKYESNEALIQALQEAPIEILEWTFTKPSQQEEN